MLKDSDKQLRDYFPYFGSNQSSDRFDTNDISKDPFKFQHHATRHNAEMKHKYDQIESIFDTRVDNDVQSLIYQTNSSMNFMSTTESFGYEELGDFNASTQQLPFNVTNESGCSPSFLNITCEVPINYAVPMYGYIAPFLLATTTVANTLIVVVLSRRHMRTPTNIVLMAMALCDMFTLLFPAPWLFYMYTFGNHYKPLYPIEACYAWNHMNEVIPAMFHTASIWLTLALAVQRYIYVCHAPVARTWCTMPRVIKCLIYIALMALIHQSTRFVDRVYVPVKIIWNGKVEEVCQVKMAPWVDQYLTLDVYYTTYFMFRVIFVHLIPCVSLVVLNVLLFKAMREAQLKRRKLFKENRKSECKKLRDSNCTTLMLIVVVTVFLLVEIPVAVVTILHIISSSITEILDYRIANILILITNFFIIVSYPINFAIYCGMSRQFRETFKELFVRGAATNRKNGGSSRYSLVNGPRTCTNETVL